MKKYFTSAISAILIWFAFFWHAWADHHDPIVQKAELIEKYILEHREKIILFAEKYSLGGNKKVRESIRELDDLVDYVDQIKKRKIETSIAETALIEIVKQIKQINTSLQYILRDEKESFERRLEKTQKKYQELWEKLSHILGQVILKIIDDFGNTSNLSEKEKRIIPHLKNLEWESQKLKNIGVIQFQNEAELKQSFLRILKNIKREIQGIYSIRREV